MIVGLPLASTAVEPFALVCMPQPINTVGLPLNVIPVPVVSFSARTQYWPLETTAAVADVVIVGAVDMKMLENGSARDADSVTLTAMNEAVFQGAAAATIVHVGVIPSLVTTFDVV